MTVIVISLLLLFIIFITSVFILNNKNNKVLYSILLLFLVFIHIFIVFKMPLDYQDRISYSSHFLDIKYGFDYVLNRYLEESDYLFYTIVNFITYLTDNLYIFYLLLYLIFIIPIITFCYKYFGIKLGYIVILCLTFFSTFYGYYLNGIRQGIAMSILLLVYYYARRNKYLFAIFFSFLAFGFHDSSIFFAMAILGLKIAKLKKSHLYWVYILTSLYLLIRFLVPSLGIENIIDLGQYDYLTSGSSDNYGSGTWWRIYLFNTGFLILFLMINDENEYKISLLSLYIVYISMFNLFGDLIYANRVAAFGWFIIPFVFIDLVKGKKHEKEYLMMVIIIFILYSFYTGIPYEFLIE